MSQSTILSSLKEKHPEIKESWQINPQTIYDHYKEKKLSLDYACQYLEYLIANYHIVGINTAIESLQLFCFIARKDNKLFSFLEALLITHIGTNSINTNVLRCIALFKLSSLFPIKSRNVITFMIKNDDTIVFELNYHFNYQDLKIISEYFEDLLLKLYYRFRKFCSKNKMKYENNQLHGYYKRIIIDKIPTEFNKDNYQFFIYSDFINKELDCFNLPPFSSKDYTDILRDKLFPELFKDQDILNEKIKVYYDKNRSLLYFLVEYEEGFMIELRNIRINENNSIKIK